MNTLTRAEEQIMQILWDIEQGTVKEIIAQMPEPKPAYNTVSTIIRILEGKGVVDHQEQGRGYMYLPILSKNDYKRSTLKDLVKGYFENSVSDLVSFFSKNEKLDIDEMEQIMQLMKNEIDKKKQGK